MRDLTASSRHGPRLRWQYRLRRLLPHRGLGRPLLTGLDVAWWANVALVSAFGVLLGLGGGQAETGERSSTEALANRIAQIGTMQDLLAYAYENNALIAAARAAWQAKVESYRVATGLPDPQLTITYFPAPLETRLGPQDWNAALSQHIPFPGKLSKAGEVVQTEARVARLQLDKAVRDVAASIRASFYELSYIRQAKKIAADNARLLEQIRAVGKTAYAEDRTALVEMLKALSQSGQIHYDAVLLDELELAEITRLNGLLNRAPQAAIGQLVVPPVQPLAHNLDELYELAETHQEDIRIAEQRVNRAEAQIDLARYGYYPDFNVGLFYVAIGNPDVPQEPSDAGKDALGLRVGLTLPIWFGKNHSRVNQARAERAKANALRQHRVNEVRTQIHTVYFRLQNARRLVQLYRQDLLPQAAQALELAETWFRAGQSGFSDVVEAQSVWYNFQLTLARAQADYGKHLAHLERLVGVVLESRYGASAPQRERHGQ